MTEIRYKLTSAHGETYGSTRWGDGLKHSAPGTGDLCGPGWIHVYSDPLLAVFLNPIHASFPNPQLCEVEVSGSVKPDHGLKEGWTEVAFRSWLPVPAVTTEQRIRFGILCAKQVYSDPAWLAWAEGWLDGSDRSEATAETTAEAATRAAARAASAASWAAARAASARAAAWAAWAAEWAAEAAALDIVAVAHQAVSQ